jgi:quercetin dioxygenase-like cupin family protein
LDIEVVQSIYGIWIFSPYHARGILRASRTEVPIRMTRWTRPLPLLAAAALGLAGCTTPPAGGSRVLLARRVAPQSGPPVAVTMVEVTYGPGESSPPHSHPCPVTGYVVSGRVRMHVEGERPAVYAAGDGFHEEAGRRHLVSANESTELPARFVAWFTCDARSERLVAFPDPTHPETDS